MWKGSFFNKSEVNSCSWIEPSFGDILPREDSSKSRTGRQTHSRKPQGQISHLKDLCDEEPQEPEIAHTVSLAFVPRTVDDLAVNKKKIEEVCVWLQSAKYANEPLFLLLTGPPGCGKKSTLKITSKKFNFELLKWNSPLGYAKPESGIYIDPHALPINFTKSEPKDFREYLISAGRYGNIASKDGTKVTLLLIDEIPSALLNDHDQLRNIIMQYSVSGASSVVFTFSDENNMNLPVYDQIFPSAFRTFIGMTHIKFNPITNTAMMKALRKLNQLPSCNPLGEKILAELCEISNGDIRNASLVYNYQAKGYERTLAYTFSKKRKRSCVESAEDISESLRRDNHVGLFRSLGRVLYAKKQADSVPKTKNLSTNSKPPKSSSGSLNIFEHNPENIVSECSDSASGFADKLQENYVYTFGSVEDMADAGEFLSMGELLISNWKDKSINQEMGLSIAVHGLMNMNKNPVRSFHAMRKSRIFESGRKYDQVVFERQQKYPGRGFYYFSDMLSCLSKESSVQVLTSGQQ